MERAVVSWVQTKNVVDAVLPLPGALQRLVEEYHTGVGRLGLWVYASDHLDSGAWQEAYLQAIVPAMEIDLVVQLLPALGQKLHVLLPCVLFCHWIRKWPPSRLDETQLGVAYTQATARLAGQPLPGTASGLVCYCCQATRQRRLQATASSLS